MTTMLIDPHRDIRTRVTCSGYEVTINGHGPVPPVLGGSAGYGLWQTMPATRLTDPRVNAEAAAALLRRRR